MIDINEIEEGILIEAADGDANIINLYAHVQCRGKKMTDEDLRRFTSTIIGSMVTQGLITLEKGFYRRESDDMYERLSGRPCTPEETELILKGPDRWPENDVFSGEEMYEFSLTDKGFERLNELVA